YENKDAHRFYLYEEKLMRWRYSENVTEEQDAVNHDLEYSEEYFKWENAILEESNMLKEMVYLNTAIPFRMTYIERILATSALSEYNMKHSADRLIDGDVTTAWVEGAAGQGKGEAITVYFDDEYLIHGININAGYQKSNELYNKNSRPEKIQVLFSDGTYELHTLSDINDSQDIVLNKAIVTDYITLTIESVYPGTKYEDTAISEIYIY
ncbi:MAG: discoidin domain-containing protein, partial [Lachnospiraceae bacterium]|nr:discoidin domain-containing protein [Lachnospiraceae bacterium]